MLTTEQLQKYASNKFFSEALHIYDPSKLDFNLLGQGEYNINYVFTHPDNGKKLVLRLNTGSQMHLPNQIEYEYHALKLLENSKRTPKAFFVDGSRKYIDFGVLVMEFLSGVPLDYKTDLSLAASCLADIHKTNIPDSTSLIKPKNPLKAILQECDAMAKKYLNSELADAFVGDKLKKMISAAARLPLDKEDDGNCIINTELNSGNFLINGAGWRNYLIDWEKPIIGEAAQDIAHFLAPTTSFWKTDIILTQEEKAKFIDEYIAFSGKKTYVKKFHSRVKIYEAMNCLRGVSWCAMAWVEYQNPKKLIRNQFTYQKIQSYLSEEFLMAIENQYFAL